MDAASPWDVSSKKEDDRFRYIARWPSSPRPMPRSPVLYVFLLLFLR
jgi:hypothetical protein